MFHYVVFALTESNLGTKEMILYMLSKCEDLGSVPEHPQKKLKMMGIHLCPWAWKMKTGKLQGLGGQSSQMCTL